MLLFYYTAKTPEETFEINFVIEINFKNAKLRKIFRQRKLRRKTG